MQTSINLRKIKTISAASCVLLASTSALAERKYKEDVKYYNDNMAVIIEQSVYDMFEDPSSNVDRESIKDPILEIMMDFKYLNQSSLPNDLQMAKKWQIKDTSAGSWMNWFSERVKVITAADHSRNEFWTKRFTIEKQFPFFEKMLIAQNTNSSDNGESVASNVTSDLILRMGPQDPLQAYSTLIGGLHFGLVKISAAFLSDNYSLKISDKNRFSFISRVYRLSTLLHEARHSDGNGDHVTFGHSLCPKEHPYSGVEICDRSQNGPNSVAADFIDLYIKGCRSGANAICTDSELDRLEGLKLKNLSVVLTPDQYKTDGANKKVVKYLDATPLKIDGIPQKEIPRN